MASNLLPPVPTNAEPGGYAWSDWYQKLRLMLNSSVRSFNTRTGAVTLTSGDVTTALTYTPYNATNPANYIDAAGVPWATPGTIGSTTPNTGAFTELSLPKTSGTGIKVDTVSPSFGWRDLLGRISVRGVGGVNPTFAVYRGGIRQFQFAVGDEVFIEFHIPHDYVPGTDIHVHTHWSLNVAAITETVTWGLEMSYAKGHNQAPFSVPVTTTVSAVSSTTQYQHIITEIQVTGGGLLVAADLEPDGLILVRPFLSANTGVAKPFLHFCDLHYQSTNIGTKQKTPNFYV